MHPNAPHTLLTPRLCILLLTVCAATRDRDVERLSHADINIFEDVRMRVMEYRRFEDPTRIAGSK